MDGRASRRIRSSDRRPPVRRSATTRRHDVPGTRESIIKQAAAGALALLSVLAFGPMSAANAFLTDTASHPPPTTGGQAYYNTYGNFGPDQPGFPGKGQSYVDPVFGSTV